jgi:HEAT repeat protein
VRSAAAEAVAALGSVAATPEFLARLAALLHHQERNVRSAAAEAVAALGSVAATPEFLAALLQNEARDVRAASETMRQCMRLGVRLFAQHRWWRRTLYRPCWLRELAEQPLAENGSPPVPVSRASALLNALFRVPPRT